MEKIKIKYIKKDGENFIVGYRVGKYGILEIEFEGKTPLSKVFEVAGFTLEAVPAE